MFIALGRPRWSCPPGRLGLFLASLLMVLGWQQPATAQQAAAENMVTDIKTTSRGDGVEVMISTVRHPDSSVFTLSSPSRVVVDIAETLPGRFTAVMPVNKGPVKDIVAKEFKDAEGTITRITIQLDSVVDYKVEPGDTDLRIVLTPKATVTAEEEEQVEDGDLLGAEIAKMESGSGDASEQVEELTLSGQPSVRREEKSSSGGAASSTGVGGSTEITGLDFGAYEKRSRVIISSLAPIRYTASPVNKDRQVVIDIPDAYILNKNLLRPLDTSEFPSAVKMISAYPMKGSRKGVRVVVKLRENVNYKVDEQGNRVFFDFPVPETIAAHLPENPAGEGEMMPTTVGEGAGMSNAAVDQNSASPRHQLISASGQVSDGQNLQSSGGAGADGVMGVAMDATPSNVNFTGRKISIDVREADLHNVFRMISNVSKLNIVAGDNVTGKVTVRLQNVPWDQALAVILQSKGLGAVRFGNIIRIAPLAVLKEEREAQLNAEKANHNLEPLQTLIVPLNYAIASDVKAQVEGGLSDRGKLTIDSRTNALIIEDTAQGLAKARQLALSLDTQTPQVLIEARIVEVSSTYLRDFGIQWGGEVNAGANTGVGTGLYFPSSVALSGGLSESGQALRAGTGQPNWVVDLPAASSAGAMSLSLGSISDIINVDARLTAIETMGKGKVISAPKVITVDNKEATISQGTRIPYETVSAAGTAVQFIEATLKLAVTPHITQDNRVFLKVKVTNNRPDFGQAVNGNPAIEIKEAATEVMVKDGDTTVLGGVYTLIESEAVTGLPGISKIPFLGWLFKGKQNRSERKELLVFITPHVVARKASKS